MLSTIASRRSKVPFVLAAEFDYNREYYPMADATSDVGTDAGMFVRRTGHRGKELSTVTSDLSLVTEERFVFDGSCRTQ